MRRCRDISCAFVTYRPKAIFNASFHVHSHSEENVLCVGICDCKECNFLVTYPTWPTETYIFLIRPVRPNPWVDPTRDELCLQATRIAQCENKLGRLLFDCGVVNKWRMIVKNRFRASQCVYNSWQHRRRDDGRARFTTAVVWCHSRTG